MGGGEVRAVLKLRELDGAEIERLGRWLDHLEYWNARVNLTGLRSAEDRVGHLVDPVIRLRLVPAEGDLIDVGSGNGSPGLVFASLRPDLRVTLLEPRTRRWAFLREAVRLMGVMNVQVVKARHDQYPGPPASTICLRAVAIPLPGLVPLLAAGGRVVVMGAEPPVPPGWGMISHPAPGAHVLSLLDT